MGRGKQPKNIKDQHIKSDNSPTIIVAIIGAIGFIIVALINRSTAITTTLQPIEATQTAEALHTTIAMTNLAYLIQPTYILTPSLISNPLAQSTITAFTSLLPSETPGSSNPPTIFSTFTTTSSETPTSQFPITQLHTTLLVSKYHNSNGYYLNVKGGLKNYDVQFGPLSDGAYIVDPDEKFAVYVDNFGNVYFAGFGNSFLNPLPSLDNSGFKAFINGDTPDYQLALQVDKKGTYWVTIIEQKYAQTSTIMIPRNLAHK